MGGTTFKVERDPGRRDRVRARADGRPFSLRGAEDRSRLDRRRRRQHRLAGPEARRRPPSVRASPAPGRARSATARAAPSPRSPTCCMLIGYMDPDIFLGGTMKLDRDGRAPVFDDKIARAARHAGRGGRIRHLSRRVRADHRSDPRDHGRARPRSARLRPARIRRQLRHAVRHVRRRSSTCSRIVVPYTASVNCAFGLVVGRHRA